MKQHKRRNENMKKKTAKSKEGERKEEMREVKKK